MNARSIMLGGCLFAAGVLLGEVWSRVQPPRPAVLPASSVTKGEIPETPTFSSMEEAIRKAPELVLEDLSNDPYLRLTDAELKLLAETIDLRKESHRRLLNQVTPPDYGEILWIATIRANVGKMPLKELLGLSHKARTPTNKRYIPIVEAVQASPDKKEILATWGRGFLQAYIDHTAPTLPDLKEAMAMVPADVAEPEMREELLNTWVYHRPTASSMEAVFKLPPEHMRKQSVMQNAAARVWSKSPAERKEVLAKVSELPGPQRNRILGTLAYATKPDDTAGMASVLSQFTSFSYQQDYTERWLKKQDAEGKQKLIAELDALPDTASVRKLRASLVEKAEGK